MKTLTQVLVPLCLCIVFAMHANAQGEQVAFIPGVFELINTQRQQADVLKDYEKDFDRAQLFLDDGQYVLRIFFRKKRESWSEDVPLSQEELTELREAILASRASSGKTADEDDKSSRYYLVTSASLHSIPQSIILANLTRQKVTVVPDFGPPYSFYEKSTFGLALPFFTTAGAITSSILLTRDRYISPAAANMHFFGSAFGYGHGAMIASTIKRDRLFIGDDARFVTESLLISGVSIVEGWVGYYLAKKRKFTYAQSMAYNTGNFWGGSTGLLGYQMTAGSFDADPAGYGFFGLAGSLGGLWLFDVLHKKRPRSSGDLRAINTAGFIGVSLGLAFVYESTNDRAISAAALIGAGVGIASTYMSTSSTNFSKFEGGMILLSSIGGFALGTGVGLVSDLDSGSAVFSMAFGATLGWIGSYLYFKNNESTRRTRSKDLGNNLQFNINPAGLTMLMSSPDQQMNMMRQNIQMNMMSLNYSF